MNKTTNFLVGVAVCLLSGVAVSGCGDDDDNAAPPLADTLGGFNFDCGGNQQQQQSKQVPFQQQQGCAAQTDTGQQKQEFTFTNSRVTDFDVTLDCDRRQVVVESKGQDNAMRTIPIRSDGTVRGTLNFVNQVADDGKGSGTCWVGYIVTFDGKATCDFNTPDATPSPGATPGPDPKGSLSLTTQVDFEPATTDDLIAAGIPTDGLGGPLPQPTPSASPEMPGQTPSPVPSVSPSPTPSASPSPSPTVSPTPSPSPTVTILPTPGATPTPGITPVKFCLVEDPCPIEGKTDLVCE